MKAILHVAALLLFWISAYGADATSPLQPFLPEPQKPGIYDPGKFIKPADAMMDLNGSMIGERSFATTSSLNGFWQFSGLEKSPAPFPADADLAKGVQAPDFDASKWEAIAVPSNFYKKHPSDVNAPYVKCWYRKSIAIPANLGDRRVVLHFGVAAYEARLFVNGKEAGSHHGDFTPWDIDITSLATPGREAVLALRIFSDLGPKKAIGADKLITAASHAYGCQYAKDWIKGGLWQDVEMRIEPAIRIKQALVSPDLDSSSLNVQCLIVNNSLTERTLSLFGCVSDAKTKDASPSPCPTVQLKKISLKPGENELSCQIPLKEPKLWTPADPQLYNLSLALVDGQQALDLRSERFGYRSFKVDGRHFKLNGKRIYLFGGSVTLSSPYIKPNVETLSASDEGRRMTAEMLLGFKSIGVNTLRLSEQPPQPAFYDLADEVGLLLFNMWAWSYSDKLAPDFERNNSAEVAEWVRRDYNHPSVAIWLGGNEIKCNQGLVEALDRQAQLIRSIERSGRPVCSFSGSACHEFGGRFKLDTDLLSLHSYIGLGDEPWTVWQRNIGWNFNMAAKNYAKNGKDLDLPYVAWELVGFSWGAKYAPYTPGDVNEYLKWANSKTSWGSPNGIGWAGAIGLDAALDRKRGAIHAMTNIGSKIIDYVREDQRIDGYAPWFIEYSKSIPAYPLWTQPVYCGLRGSGGFPPRNIFAGSSLPITAFIVNSSNEAHPDSKLAFSLAEADGSERPLAEWPIANIGPWQKETRQITLQIPDAKGSRWAQVRMRAFSQDGKEISRNFCDIFIQSMPEAVAPVKSRKTLGLLSCNASDEATAAKILKELGVKAASMAKPEELKSLDVLIVPPSSKALEISPAMQSAILDWVKDGGTLLALEQAWEGEFPLLSKKLSKGKLGYPEQVGAVFTELVLPKHEAFKGLSQANFEFWSGNEFAQTGSHVTSPLGEDLVAAKGPMCGKQDSFAVLTDAKQGKGRIISSQFNACAAWGIDSAASVYLRNLLCSATQGL